MPREPATITLTGFRPRHAGGLWLLEDCGDVVPVPVRGSTGIVCCVVWAWGAAPVRWSTTPPGPGVAAVWHDGGRLVLGPWESAAVAPGALVGVVGPLLKAAPPC